MFRGTWQRSGVLLAPVRAGALAWAVLAPPAAAAVVSAAAGAASSAAPAAAPPAPSAGAVVALHGTAHLWLADEQGVLHWVGDTRALGGRGVDWGQRTEVLLELLKTYP